MTHAAGESVTETSGRVDGAAAPFGRRGWVHLAWWLCAWNAAVPIRLVGMLIDAADRPRFRATIGYQIGTLILDQTSWAVATYVMFRLALRARRAPQRRVVTLLGVLAVLLAAAAVVATSLRTGTPRGTPYDVEVPGGHLTVTWREDGHVVLTGPAVLLAEGTVSASQPGAFARGAVAAARGSGEPKGLCLA